MRHAHLVGSIPCATPEEAMRLGLERLGGVLGTLPDGETGERRNWINHIVDSFRSHPDFRLRRDGDWSSYRRTPQFRVRRSRSLDPKRLDLGHVAPYSESYETFRTLRAQRGFQQISFQAGIPSDLDLSLFTLGPVQGLRWRWAFREATVREIRALHEAIGDDVVFQLELPVELVILGWLPRPMPAALAPLLARGVARLAAQAPAGARFGLHLCLGDLNHRALGRLRDTSPVVQLVRQLTARWPDGRSLEYVHVPLAAGQRPAPMERRFYEPLSGLRLPPSVRFIAGFVHEDRTLEEQRWILGTLEELLGRKVDVAAACGLGRRSLDAAVQTMDQAAALCEV